MDGMAVNYDSNASKIDREKANAELKARKLKKGLWSEGEGIFLTKDEVEENSNDHLNEFRIVKGTVKTVKLVKDQLYINFGDDWKKDFTVKISKRNFRNFDNIETLVNKDVIVKGWIEFYNGPAMEIYNQSNLYIM